MNYDRLCQILISQIEGSEKEESQLNKERTYKKYEKSWHNMMLLQKFFSLEDIDDIIKPFKVFIYWN